MDTKVSEDLGVYIFRVECNNPENPELCRNELKLISRLEVDQRFINVCPYLFSYCDILLEILNN
jgi:hypothetical protein